MLAVAISCASDLGERVACANHIVAGTVVALVPVLGGDLRASAPVGAALATKYCEGMQRFMPTRMRFGSIEGFAFAMPVHFDSLPSNRCTIPLRVSPVR